jgi:hypothetical protein
MIEIPLYLTGSPVLDIVLGISIGYVAAELLKRYLQGDSQ